MNDDKKQLYDIIKSYRTAMLVTETEEGVIRARPMAVARADDDGTLWFVTNIEGEVKEEILGHPKCAVTMQDSSTFLSMSGVCFMRRDEKMLNELWSRSFELWFDRSDAVVIEFQGREAEYWKEGLKGLKYLFEAARAVITDKYIRPDKVGDHAYVSLR